MTVPCRVVCITVLDLPVVLRGVLSALLCQNRGTRPGERFDYSFSTDVLGRVVEVVSGKGLGAFFRTEIFAPLAMADTGFSCADAARMSAAWVRADHPRGQGQGPTKPGSHGKLKMTFSGEPGDDVFLLPEKAALPSGGGGLVSTVSDFAKFGIILDFFLLFIVVI